MAKTGGGNWLSTYNGYSLISASPYLGPDGVDTAAGDYAFTVDLWRTDVDTIEVTFTVENADISFNWTLTVNDTGDYALATPLVIDTLAFSSVATGEDVAKTFTLSDVVVQGLPADDFSTRTWAGYPIDFDGYGTVPEVGGDIFVFPNTDDYVYVYSIANWLYVPSETRTAIAAGEGFWIYAYGAVVAD
jgi:hypothetical protein